KMGTVPLGRPLLRTQAYVLNGALSPEPIGAVGELYLGGGGLGRGYLGRAELTAERVVPNPFSKGRGERWYRTGDRGRCLEEGEVELLGRVEDQVKIRGHRIEPAEIESVLREYPGMGQAVVRAREGRDGEKRLVAYLECGRAEGPEITELRRFLKERLPGY